MMNKINSLKQDWITNTNDAITFIETTLSSQPEDYEKEYHKLVTWIVNTDISHWEFMPKGYESVIDNAIDFKSFLHNVHHAMVDDGEMTFVKVKDHGSFIVFADKNEEYFQSVVEKHLQDLGNTIKRNYESTLSIVDNTDSEHLQTVYKKRLSTMPKSLKDLEYTYHQDVDSFIKDIETYQKERAERHTKVDEMMKKFRMQ